MNRRLIDLAELRSMPGRVLLDTNVLVDAFQEHTDERGSIGDLFSQVLLAHRAVSIVSRYEFLYDACAGMPLSDFEGRARWLDERVHTKVGLSMGVSDSFASLLSAKTKPLKSRDGWIAATALRLHWPVATRDAKDFEHIQALSFVRDFLNAPKIP